MGKNDGEFRFVALQLCFIFLVVYAAQVFFGFQPGFSTQAPIWKYFTSIFGHSSPNHLFNNLFFIGLFGSVYELLTSGRTLIKTFLVAALFANLSAFIFYPGSTIIGASAGGTGILAALTVYRPNKIGLALGVPVPMWAALLMYVFINLAGLSSGSGIAYEAHLLGMVAGALFGLRLRERSFYEEGVEEEGEREDWRERIRRWEEDYML